MFGSMVNAVKFGKTFAIWIKLGICDKKKIKSNQ